MVKLKGLVEIYKQVLKFALLGMVLYFIASNAASSAIVTITMDDDYFGQYKYAYPILHERNINATVFVFTENIGQTGGGGTITFLTIPQLTEMRDSGWEIASHTITHPDMTTLNDSQLEYEVNGSKAYLTANGFDPKTFAYPYGKYNDNVTQIVKKYFTIARNTHQGNNPIPPDITNFNFEGRGVGNQNETVIKRWIDDAIVNNEWLILYFHDVNASGYVNTSVNERGQNLTVIADYIKSKVDAGQLKSKTFYEGWLEATKITLPNSNLLQNPGFESGTTKPLNWNLVTVGSNTPIWDTVSHTGTRAIKISNQGTTNSRSGYPQSDFMTAATLQTYTFSAWVKSLNSGGDSSPAVRVVELDENKNRIRQTSLYFNQGTNDWTYKLTTFQTAINTKYLCVYANIWNGYGTFWLDDLVLTVSEP